MSTTCRRLSGVLAISALVLSVRVGIARAASPNAITETYLETQAISYVLGSTRAIGYFQTTQANARSP